ncbi:MAG: hypothetical protein H6559_12310 [Lewinellaceae bacterium]|nr:hypothetical protein [Lewinellaceae bacterium]
MKSKTVISKLWYIIPLFLILLGIDDLYGAIKEPEQYPFGGAMFGKWSIYQTRERFICYNIIGIFSLGSVIYSDFRRWRLVFWVTLLISIIVLCYPLITNNNDYF